MVNDSVIQVYWVLLSVGVRTAKQEATPGDADLLVDD
jgi:hypothetical protein